MYFILKIDTMIEYNIEPAQNSYLYRLLSYQFTDVGLKIRVALVIYMCLTHSLRPHKK
jgi:hypothetical protein